ncbi:MAG: TerC family rane protein [Symbiobacteriaceae bacterium]|jgi:tellurite resistance protein TerC|nr:TerC family rane protein [Symbiobacteriaceae bacterium]
MLAAHGVEMVLFLAFVAFATWLDLFVLHKDDHEIGLKEAAWTSLIWIMIALLFSGYVYWRYGGEMWMQYIAGYFLEKALSVDNIFVIATIFGFFGIRGGLQHRALAWGVIGAIVMRAVLIVLGVELVHRFNWLLPLFGVFLLVTAWRMVAGGGHEGPLEESKMYKWTAKLFPVYPGFVGNQILTRHEGKNKLTFLGMSIVMVELTDLVFAVDSIPAVMGVSTDFFIILTSNVFAILGLRALYFLLAGIMDRFRYLKIGLSLVLAFIGAKMVALGFGFHLNIGISLGVVLGVIAASVALSLLIPVREKVGND